MGEQSLLTAVEYKTVKARPAGSGRDRTGSEESLAGSGFVTVYCVQRDTYRQI